MPAESVDLGILLPAWSALPFAGILLSIALFPLLAPHFWHRHFPKVSAVCAVAFAVPFVLRFGGAAVHELLHVLIVDYVPFLVLIATLFTIGGGVHVAGTLREQRPQGPAHQDLADRRELGPQGRAPEQPGAKLTLEPGQAPPHRGLTHPEDGRGRGERPVTREREQVPQVVPVDGRHAETHGV